VPVAVFSCHPVGGDPNHIHAPERFRPWTGGREERALVLRPAAAVPPCLSGCAAADAHCIAAIDPADAIRRILALAAANTAGQG
jgi:hypothetical protein